MSGILHNAGVDPERDEKARRAVKAFRAMQPTLTSYARMVTKRRDVRVELATSMTPSTDDRRIYYRPPIDMGDNTPHERRLCDKRDENLQPLCPACLIREKVLVSIFHEIGHIAKGSFQEPSAGEIQAALEAALAEAPKDYADRVRSRFDSASPYVKRHLTGVAGLVNEYLPFLVNCLEDARVDREMFKARKGLKVMFDANVWQIFNDGIETPDGYTTWKEQPQNNQIMVGAYAKAAGYDVTGWFILPVEQALADEGLTTLLRRIDTVRSASGAYQLAFSVLAKLRELGFCGTPVDPDPPPPMPEPDPEGEPEDQDESELEPEDEGEDGDRGSEEGTPAEGGEGQGEGSGESSPDEDEGSGDREPSEDERPERSDNGDQSGAEQPTPDYSDEFGPDGVDDEQGTETSEGGSVPESSDSSEVGDDSEDSSEVGDESTEGEDPDSSEQAGTEDSADETDSDSGMESPEASDGDQSGDRSKSEGSDPEDSSGDEGESGGSIESGEADGGPSESGDSRDDAPDYSDESGSKQSPEGLDTSDDHSDSDLDAEGDGGALGASDGDNPELQHSAGEAVDPSDFDPEGPDSDSPAIDEDDSLIDTGADTGMGGVEVIEKEEFDDIPMGSPEDLNEAFKLFHPDPDDVPKTIEEQANEEAVDRAIIQGIYFETPSRNVYGVREHHYGEPVLMKGHNVSSAWDPSSLLNTLVGKRFGRNGEFDPDESILAPALLEMRITFADNKRGENLRHRKGGKVDGRVLGKRAHLGDERLFKKKILPGKKDYVVLIAMDVSGSTLGKNIHLEKCAVMAQAELLDRMGIKFAIYAHTGDYHDPYEGRGGGLDLDIYHIKDISEPWDPERRKRLIELGPAAANLDGHSLEFYRKVLDSHVATDKILLYYTDGKMPAENHDEELEILQREIRTCANKGYVLLGVGIRTDSPVRHGLDTVQVDEDADIVKVVKHLESRLI